MVTVSSGVPQPAESAEGRIVGEEDWQRCRRILEARKAEEQSPPMQEHIADLSDVLQKLNKQQRPNQSELRQMAKSLGLPQKKDGLNIDVPTLLQNIQQAFLQEVESLRERRSNLESPAASSSGGEHPAVRQILQDVLEFGRLPKELKNPKTETEVAELKLAKQVRKHKLRERAQEMLEKLKASRDTSSGSSHPAASGNPFTASGGSDPDGNLPNSAAFATIQEQQAFLQEVESLRERRSNLESPAASSSGGEHQILQEVLELGRLPKEFKICKTGTELAERRLANRVRVYNLGERAQEMLEKVKASRDTSSGSSHPAASGSSHPAASGSDPDAPRTGSGVPQPAEIAEERIVGEEDWQRCRRKCSRVGRSPTDLPLSDP